MTYQEFKEAVIKYSKEKGIADYELYYTNSESIDVEVYKTEVSKYSTEASMGVCYRMVKDGKAGYASTENLTDEEAESLVSRALDNLSSIESDEESFIHEKGDTYAKPEVNSFRQPDGNELIRAALNLQKEIYAADKRVIDGTQAYGSVGKSAHAIFNSKGIDLEEGIDYTLCYAMALLSDGEEMYNGFKVEDGEFDKFDYKKIAAKAVEEATSTIGASSVPSGKYNVIFAGEAFTSLLVTYSSVFSAEAAQKGISLLNGKEGEKIAADIVTLVDDPMYKDCIAKSTFDDEGVATYTKNVIENGVLKTMLHNLSTAAKAGVKSTGNGKKGSYASTVGVGPFTMYLKPGKRTREEMMASVKDGIVIKNVSGLHAGANPLTGDFSLLAEGYRFENGVRTNAVKNITVSGNFYSLLKEVKEIGSDLEFFGVLRKNGSPSVLVEDMTIAGE